MPINSDSLKLLRDEDRKIVLTFVEDENEDKTKKLVKLLKAAASANRDYLFAYAGLQQFQDFVETFEISKTTKLPKMVVWDGNEEYFNVSHHPLFISRLYKAHASQNTTAITTSVKMLLMAWLQTCILTST